MMALSIITALCFTLLHVTWLFWMLLGFIPATIGWFRTRPGLELLYLATIAMTAANRLSGSMCVLSQGERYFLAKAYGVSTLGYGERILSALHIDPYGLPLFTVLSFTMALGVLALAVQHLKAVRSQA